MAAPDTFQLWRSPAPHPAVDDAYTAWRNAHNRCTAALRAWRAAPSAQRDRAYREYRLALDGEEVAATELERAHAA